MQPASDTYTHTHAAVNTYKYFSYDGKGETTTNRRLTITAYSLSHILRVP